MLPLIGLHQLAAQRGDGLRPELLELLRRRAETIEANPKVAEIAGHRQAGPNPPAPVLDGALPENVVAFPAPASTAGGRMRANGI